MNIAHSLCSKPKHAHFSHVWSENGLCHSVIWISQRILSTCTAQLTSLMIIARMLHWCLCIFVVSFLLWNHIRSRRKPPKKYSSQSHSKIECSGKYPKCSQYTVPNALIYPQTQVEWIWIIFSLLFFGLNNRIMSCVFIFRLKSSKLSKLIHIIDRCA